METMHDEKLQRFISLWDDLSDQSRSKFVDEHAEELVYFDLKHRLQPGPAFVEFD
jgi:hypothetical protein